jgi:hypothetical protein
VQLLHVLDHGPGEWGELVSRPKSTGYFVVCPWVGVLQPQSWGDLIAKLELNVWWSPRKLVKKNDTLWTKSGYSDKARILFQADQDTVGKADSYNGKVPANDTVCWYGPHVECDLNEHAIRAAQAFYQVLPSHPLCFSLDQILLHMGNVVTVRPDPNSLDMIITERRTLVGVTPLMSQSTIDLGGNS